ncbi:pentatricopeptide repeat-containing protein At2g13600 [Ziziphus jujuba]|uniref:Pentatricopeptide repeat-containing protein At2g13600 n=1 Tax=Ziziphus jujuba TaxID=326968 RepID=A0A6P4A0H1_ZIZJJ|nr:pentatricopeptide repeat-containing protein At2g13600 [Ziziphus jujuba]
MLDSQTKMSAQLVKPITHHQLPTSSQLNRGSKNPLSHKPTGISFHRREPTSQTMLISLQTDTHAFIFDKPVNSTSYATVLESCKCPHLGKQIHAHTIKTGFHGVEFVGTKLLQMYSRCGCLEDAVVLFDGLPLRNLYSWTAILGVHVDHGFFDEALFLFLELQLEGIGLEFFVFPLLFKICSGLGGLELGRQFHAIAIKFQFFANKYVGNALVDMYGKCGSLDDAKKVITKMVEKDHVSWNSIITACATNGRVYEALDYLNRMHSDKLTSNLVSWSAVLGGFSQNGYDEEAIELLFRMQAAGFRPNAQTLASVLPVCARLRRLGMGKEIHGYITRHGFLSNPFLLNGLVDMYRKCADMRSGFKIFSNFLIKSTLSYNTMVVGYFENGDISKAKELFDQMESTGAERNLVSWNSMISGYTDNFLFDEALGTFQELLSEGIEPDSFTLGSVLTACAGMPSFRLGKEIHSQAILRGLQSNSFVGGALVEMYTRFEDLPAAQMAFDEVSERDMATWNILISGYARCNQIEKIQNCLQKMREDGFEPNIYTWNGILAGYVGNNHFDSAMELFSEMQTSNLRPDIYTVGIMLPACSRLATIERGKQLHAHSIRCGYDWDVYIGAALVDMYAKCGSLKHALQAYNRITNPNLVSHNAMLTAYAMHGYGEEGITFFFRMLEDGFRPDYITFLSVLSSCVHAGSVETGYEFFASMQYYNLKPTLKHYTCMVDLLSRAGQLNEAYKFAKKLPMEPDSVLWGALLGGCVVHGNVELGETVAKKLTELEPNNTGNYVLLANLYAYKRRWNDLARIRQLMKDKGMHKDPGCSWIEDRDEIHVFRACDKSHRRATEIYDTVNNLISHIKTANL